MSHRGLRYTVVGVLLLVGAGAATVAWRQLTEANRLAAAHSDVVARIDRMAETLARALDVQRDAVALGLSALALPDHAPLLPEVEAEAELVRRQGVSPGRASHLRRVLDASVQIVGIAARARESAAAGHPLMTADLVVTGSREAEAGATAALAALRRAEIRTVEQMRTSLATRSVQVLAAAAASWAVGLILLAPVPRSRDRVGSSAAVGSEKTPSIEQTPPAGTGDVPEDGSVGTATTPGGPEADTAPLPGLDQQRLADACGALARAATEEALERALDASRRALQAQGLVVWIDAGGHLRVGLGSGYSGRLLASLGSLGRSEANATSVAWSTGEVQTVAASDGGSGALAAPIIGPDACVGVLTIEVPAGRERDPGVRAGVAVVAAQLSGLVAGWATSAAPNAVPVPEAPESEPLPERRQA